MLQRLEREKALDLSQFDKNDELAIKKYADIKKDKTDVRNIAANTAFTEKAIAEIKQHLFFNKEFVPDLDQAEAWERLSRGEGTEVDVLLLKHEYIEIVQMKYYNKKYQEAHDYTNTIYCWACALMEEKERVLENLKIKRDR